MTKVISSTFIAVIFIPLYLFFSDRKEVSEPKNINSIPNSASDGSTDIVVKDDDFKSTIDSSSVEDDGYVNKDLAIPLAHDYLTLNRKYIELLPPLARAEMAGNFMPLKPVVNLWSKVRAGDMSAKVDYEKQLQLLKTSANDGDVRGQMDYAMFLTLDAHSSVAEAQFEQRLALAKEAKE